MPKSEPLLTTKEFAQKAGISTATVSVWLKKGKIKGKKNGTRWLIAATELGKSDAARPAKAKKRKSPKMNPTTKNKKAAEKGAKPTASTQRVKPAVQKAETASGGKTFSVEVFAEMTYLTTFGVEKWLKEGRLTGGVNASGQRCVDAANLKNAHVKRILR